MALPAPHPYDAVAKPILDAVWARAFSQLDRSQESYALLSIVGFIHLMAHHTGGGLVHLVPHVMEDEVEHIYIDHVARDAGVSSQQADVLLTKAVRLGFLEEIAIEVPGRAFQACHLPMSEKTAA